jgi:hypothetical protein
MVSIYGLGIAIGVVIMYSRSEAFGDGGGQGDIGREYGFQIFRSGRFVSRSPMDLRLMEFAEK